MDGDVETAQHLNPPQIFHSERERDPPCPGEVNHPADILTNFITIKPTNIQIHIARLSTIYTVSNIASITGYKQEIRCDPSLFRQPYIPFLKSGEVRGNARAFLRIDSNAHIYVPHACYRYTVAFDPPTHPPNLACLLDESFLLYI